MAKPYIPPPSIEHMISCMIEWIARHMRAKVTITVDKGDRGSFTETYDGRV